jgi:tetratricopeptide (TPR) repeat protein
MSMADARSLGDLRKAVQDAEGRDWPQALALGRELAARFPAHAAGYQAQCAAARALKLFDHAAALLDEAEERFPGSAWPLIERARMALARAEEAVAAELAAALRRDFPDLEAGYQIGLLAARRLSRPAEAVALGEAALRRFPERPWAWIEAALAERMRGDEAAALALAEQAIVRFPAAEQAYQIVANTARLLDRPQQAAAAVAEALRRFPERPWPWIAAARAARAGGDDKAARRFAETLRQRFADAREGYQIGAQAARNLVRYEEALAIAAEAARRFPAEAWPAIETAWTLRADGDLEQAALAAEALRARFPDKPEGYRVGVAVLQDADRLDEIQALLDKARRQFPAEDWVGETEARVTRLIAARAQRGRVTQAIADLTQVLSAYETSLAPPVARVIVVLGMHRAGTSFCAKMLTELGVSLGGPLMPAAKSNPDGHYEHMEIVRLHEALLGHEERSWDSLHLLEPRRAVASESERAAIRARLRAVVAAELAAAGGVWAFKDPRTARLLPVWREILDELNVSPVWVVALRDPRAVALSLQTRDRMPLEIGEFLWCEHYLDILRHLGSRIDLVVQHERWFSAPGPQMAQLAEAAGLADRAAAVRIEEALRPAVLHDLPADQPFQLSLARHLHAALSADGPDLGRLQREAERLWHYAARLRSETP